MTSPSHFFFMVKWHISTANIEHPLMYGTVDIVYICIYIFFVVAVFVLEGYKRRCGTFSKLFCKETYIYTISLDSFISNYNKQCRLFNSQFAMMKKNFIKYSNSIPYIHYFLGNFPFNMFIPCHNLFF